MPPIHPPLPLDCAAVLHLTRCDLASRTHALGNPAIMWLVGHAQHRQHMDALNAAVLRDDLEAAKVAGRALIQWAKAQLADPALVQQCQADQARIAAMQAAALAKGEQG